MQIKIAKIVFFTREEGGRGGGGRCANRFWQGSRSELVGFAILYMVEEKARK
jgi:hypothetical protein